MYFILFNITNPITIREHSIRSCQINVGMHRENIFSATGGADSGPASLEGTPTDDKNGQQAFGAGKLHSINP